MILEKNLPNPVLQDKIIYVFSENKRKNNFFLSKGTHIIYYSQGPAQKHNLINNHERP